MLENLEQGSLNARTNRQREILDHVLNKGTVAYAELVNLTGKSLMTIHRDVDDLVARGLLRKFHGGVSALPTSVFESSSEFRLLRNVEKKVSLAKKAIEFIDPGMSILLDDSTSSHALAKLLVDFGPLTIVTNYLPNINILTNNPEIKLIVLGGSYSKTHDSFIGLAEETGLSSYSIDMAFLSTSTIKGSMTYHPEQEIVIMKKDMMKCSKRNFLLMDTVKVGQTSLHKLAPVKDFSDVILNADVDRELSDEINEHTLVHFAR